MGKPTGSKVPVLCPEFIGAVERTRGSETSQYPEEKKTMSDSRSSGERNGKNKPKPAPRKWDWGCGSTVGPWTVSRTAWNGRPERVIAA